MDKTLADIDALKARWMTGADTDDAGPQDWQGLDRLAQLALAGQFIRVATRPAAATNVKTRPQLPQLGLPPLPEEHRPILRRALEAKEAGGAEIVTLLAARGYCVNPLDWMPKRSDTDLPAIYSPWRDWLEGSDVADSDLTAENWAEQPPHSRYIDLEALHRSAPEAARKLIAEVAPTVAADQRLRLLDCLQYALTEADAELLESFLKDRSSKVQAQVKTQLARLGRVTDEEDAEAAAEVPDFLQTGKSGILARRKSVSGRKLKNEAQRRRRRDMLGRLSLGRLAAALDLTADEFIDQWQFGEANDEVFCVVAASGTDQQVEHLIERAIKNGDRTPYILIDRLSAERRKSIALSVLAKDDWDLSDTRYWLKNPDGTVPQSVLPKRLFTELVKKINDDKVAEHQINSTLTYLGLLVDQPAAATLLDDLTGAGVLAVDPRLTLLRLNAAL